MKLFERTKCVNLVKQTDECFVVGSLFYFIPLINDLNIFKLPCTYKALLFFGILFSFFFFFFFNSVLRAFQDYFSSYETGQSVGGAKTGEPREKPPDTPASRTWLVSHVARAGLEPTPVTAVR